jgi:hypothetical protein
VARDHGPDAPGPAPSLRGLLTAGRRPGAATARLLCVSGAGFTDALADEADAAADVRLVTPADLYSGAL